MSILIGLYVADTLANDASVVSKVGDRIYPIVAAQGVDGFPYIVFSSSGGDDTMTKDGSGEESATVQLSVVSKLYSDALLLGQAVKTAFRGHLVSYETFEVTEVGNMTYTEDYLEALDAYVVNLSIEFKTIEV